MTPCKAWFRAVDKFTAALADADDAEEALEVFVAQAHEAGRARSAALYLPSVGGQWICEFAHGHDAQMLVGTSFSTSAENLRQLDSGAPVLERSAMHLPLQSAHALLGCLTVERGENGEPLDEEERDAAMVLARLGALALDLIGSRQAQDLAVLLEERERISRDLHDLGIQDLFATGMHLQKLRGDVESGLSPRRTSQGLAEAMERLDEAVRQIRTIVYRLRDEEVSLGLVDALEREASRARTNLGFAPALTFEVDGELMAPDSDGLDCFRHDAPRRLNDDLTEDVVAVVREALTNVARHAGAHSAQVRVSVFGTGPTGEVEVVIVDDGSGVDPSRNRNSGLANMLRRAEAHGGSFAMSSGPRGRGTSLVWRSPLG